MAEGSDALLDRLDRVTKDEFDAKMLGRVGRGHFAEVKFLKKDNTLARGIRPEVVKFLQRTLR